MAYCKKFIILFLILFIVLFNFSCVFASEGTLIEGIYLTGVYCSPNSNYYTSGNSLTYYPVKKGYTYVIERRRDEGSPQRCYVFSSDLPAVNVPYTLLGSLEGEGIESFTYMPLNDGYISINWGAAQVFRVTEYKIEGQDNAISDLVENVGPNAFWGVFGSGIDFIFVIVIVAFGLFIIVKLIKGLSKGKSKI